MSSYYPNLSIINQFYPVHLDTIFCDVYKGLYEKRKHNKDLAKKNNDARLDKLQNSQKLAMNACYGKSKDKYSFLYYPKMTMQICINGQLLLTMLVNMLYNTIPNEDFQMIQANTDGITFRIKRKHRELASKVSQEWQDMTGLELEAAYYSKMIIENVNNYIAVKTDGKVKAKGYYEEITDKNIDNAWHKNHSHQIIPRALVEYFVHGIPVEDTIKNCEDLFMFYLSKTCKSGQIIYSMDKEGNIEEQQKVTRYYIANRGVALYTSKPDSDSKEKVNSGYNSIVANKHIEMSAKDADINYNFYIRECNKRINVIQSNQATLF